MRLAGLFVQFPLASQLFGGQIALLLSLSVTPSRHSEHRLVGWPASAVAPASQTFPAEQGARFTTSSISCLSLGNIGVELPFLILYMPGLDCVLRMFSGSPSFLANAALR